MLNQAKVDLVKILARNLAGRGRPRPTRRRIERALSAAGFVGGLPVEAQKRAVDEIYGVDRLYPLAERRGR